MDTFVKTALAVAGLFLIVPLVVWAATGNLRHARFALKRYLLVIGILTIPAVAFSTIVLGVSWFS